MSVGYNPVRQPLNIAPPVNLPSNYGMVEKQANIQASGQIASTLSSLAPTMMGLGVSLRLKDEGREGYTKEMEAREKADYASFQANVAQETAEFNSDISHMTDKEVMTATLDNRLMALKDKVTGANGEIPLIRDKKQQEKYIQYLDNSLRPHWKAGIYTRAGAIDAQNTKIKSQTYINMGVETFNTETIKDGVYIQQESGLITPEQAELEIKNNTLKAETMDIARVTSIVASGDRFQYLAGLGMTEEEAERQGLTTPELAQMFGDKMVKRLESGLYEYTSTDDLNKAIADVQSGVEAVKIKNDTAVKQAEKRQMQVSQAQTYKGIEDMAMQTNFQQLSPDALTANLKMVSPDTSDEEIATIVNKHIQKGKRAVTEKDWYLYNGLLARTADYKPENDRDGSKARKIYLDAYRLPSEQAQDIIRRLNRSAQKLGLGKISSSGIGLLTQEINNLFADAGKSKWLGGNVGKVTVFQGKIKLNEGQAMFMNDFFTYVEQNNLNFEEARTYLESSPVYKNLKNISSVEQFTNLLHRMENPNPVYDAETYEGTF